MRSILISLVALMSMGSSCCSTASAQSLPPNRPGFVWVAVSSEPTVHATRAQVGVAQAAAEAEASRLAQGGIGYYRRTNGHPGGNMPGSRFTGTGYGYGPNNIPTCQPKGRMTLVADAVRQGANGVWFRVRAWK